MRSLEASSDAARLSETNAQESAPRPGRESRKPRAKAVARAGTTGNHCRVPRPFPVQTVRDLIGIARLLYRSWQGHGVDRDARLPELVGIGKDLQTALRLARSAKPGSRQLNEAWELAEVATRRLGGLVDAYVAVRPLIATAFDAVDQTAGLSKAAKARR